MFFQEVDLAVRLWLDLWVAHDNIGTDTSEAYIPLSAYCAGDFFSDRFISRSFHFGRLFLKILFSVLIKIKTASKHAGIVLAIFPVCF